MGLECHRRFISCHLYFVLVLFWFCSAEVHKKTNSSFLYTRAANQFNWIKLQKESWCEFKLVVLLSQVEDGSLTVDELRSRLRDLEPLEELHATIESQKWEEFSRLANSMKTLARRSQVSQSSLQSRSGTRTTSLEYSWILLTGDVFFLFFFLMSVLHVWSSSAYERWSAMVNLCLTARIWCP